MWTNIIRVFYYNDNKLILQCRLFLSFSLLLLMSFCCQTLSFVFTTVHRIVLFKVCAVLRTKSHRKNVPVMVDTNFPTDYILIKS